MRRSFSPDIAERIVGVTPVSERREGPYRHREVLACRLAESEPIVTDLSNASLRRRQVRYPEVVPVSGWSSKRGTAPLRLLLQGCLLAGALMVALASGAQVRAQAKADPHRPGCSDARCRMIESYVRAHYCGESPYGNGPDDGCRIKIPDKPRPGVQVLAEFICKWNDAKQMAVCEQRGQPSSSVRSILMHELRKLGLPASARGQTGFSVWRSTSSGWTLAAAYYSRSAGSNLELCQVIVTIHQTSDVVVLRTVPFQTTDLDVPTPTQWEPIDLADADGDGQVEVILEGDAYEDHWLEVVRGSPTGPGRAWGPDPSPGLALKSLYVSFFGLVALQGIEPWFDG